MFIPVTLASGQSFVDCVIDVTGTLRAACAVDYEGQSYAANADIAVARGKTVRLKANITQYAAISVTLAGKQLYWYVDVPKTLRYVTGDEYKALTGSTYGKLLNTQTAAQTSFSPTGTFTGGDTVAAIDYVKKDIWFFNTKSEVKKLTVAEVPVAVVFVPRWSEIEGVVVTPYVVTDSKLYRLSTTFSVAQSWDIEAGVVAASGDVEGFVALAYENKIARWKNGAVSSTLIDPQLQGIHSLYVTPSNAYVTGNANGIGYSVNDQGSWSTLMLTSNVGRYWSFDVNDTYLFAVDAANRLVARITLEDNTFTPVYYNQVPRDVVVHGDDVFVSFLDSATAKKYNKDMTSSVDVPALKSFGATYLSAYMVTNLYADAAPVTKLEVTPAPSVQYVDNIARDEEYIHQWIVDWDRPEFTTVGAGAIEVRVNGTPFTSGYLRKGDIVRLTVPASAAYYDDRQVSFVGMRAVSLVFRTEPKLFPDTAIIDPVNQAFPNIEYDASYVVEGITDGFTVDVITLSKELTFSINGDDFDKAGTIQNGDTVYLAITVKGLLAQRVPHKIVTNDGHVAASWSVLPMLLEGVTIRQESTEEKPRYGEQSVQSNIEQINAPTPVRASPALVEEWEADGTAARPSKVYLTTVSGYRNPCDAAHSSAAQAFDITQKSKQFVSPVQSADVVASSTYGVGAYAQPVFDRQNVAFALSASWMSPTATATRFAGAQYGYTAAYHMESIGAAYTYMAAQDRQSVNAVWGEQPKAVRYSLTQQFSVKAAPTRPLVNAQGLRYVPFNRFFHESLANRAAPTHRVEFVATLSPLWRYPAYALDTAALRRELGTFHEYGVDAELRVPANRVLLSASFTLRPSNNAYATSVAYVRRSAPSRLEVAIQTVRRNNAGMLIPMPVQPQFVHSSRNEYTLSSEDSSLYATEAEAIAYATAINLPVGSIQTKQLNGKWIFVLPPTATSASCPVGERPPELRRRYGYVGGG